MLRDARRSSCGSARGATALQPAAAPPCGQRSTAQHSKPGTLAWHGVAGPAAARGRPEGMHSRRRRIGAGAGAVADGWVDGWMRRQGQRRRATGGRGGGGYASCSGRLSPLPSLSRWDSLTEPVQPLLLDAARPPFSLAGGARLLLAAPWRGRCLQLLTGRLLLSGVLLRGCGGSAGFRAVAGERAAEGLGQRSSTGCAGTATWLGRDSDCGGQGALWAAVPYVAGLGASFL